MTIFFIHLTLMKKVLHKILAMVLAFVVLFSTMSFSVGMHYCGDTLVHTALFKKAKSCGMEMQKETASSNCPIIEKNCCHDEEILVKGQKELKLSFDNINLQQQVFITSFVYSYIYPLVESQEKGSTFDEYPPPLIVKTIYKLDEVYLI